MVKPLEQFFPGLGKGGFTVTSPRDPYYNCVAWAAQDTEKWWWPGPVLQREYWPENVSRETILAAFQEVFSAFGYELCTEQDAEPGIQKIALFADADDKPTHAARQLSSGRWTSKLGKLEDIEHDLLDLEGDLYGRVALIMKRAQPLGSGQSNDLAQE